MKVRHRGYTITAKREKCRAGYALLYYTIVRDADGMFVVDNFTTDESPVREFVGHMKERIDAELASAKPWGLS